MEKLLSVAIGGAAGALARYGTVVAYQRFAPSTFPLAILTVNVLGSLLFGLIWAYAEDRDWISAEHAVAGIDGLLGIVYHVLDICLRRGHVHPQQ